MKTVSLQRLPSRSRISKIFCSSIIGIVGLACTIKASNDGDPALFYVDRAHDAGPHPEYPNGRVFQTISEARRAVDRFLERESQPVVVYLKGGLYELTAPLRFEPDVSKSASQSITFRAIPGETPVLSGGKRFPAEWTSVGKNLWSTEIGNGLQFRQLYLDGEKALRARTPNAGSYGRFINEKAADGFDIDKALTENVASWDGVEIAAKSKWMHKRLPIVDVRELEGQLVRAVIHPELWEPIVSGIQGTRTYKNEDYWLENSPAFLDAHNEWFYDPESGRVTIFHNGENLPTEIIIPQLATLLELEGTLDQPIRDLTFDGLTFRHTGWAAPNESGFVDVQANTLLPVEHDRRKDPEFRHNQRKERIPAALSVRAGRNIRIENCTFEDLGGTGLTFDQGGMANVIVSNHFKDLAASAIEIGNDVYRPEDLRMWPRRYLVFNNRIEHVGTEYFGSIGIMAFCVDGIRIWNNHVSQVPYSGISVGWGWHPGDVVTQARDASIRHNLVEDYLLELKDGAGIYSPNPVFGGVIEQNVIRKMRTDWPDPAIYNDGSGAYWTIRENVIENAERWLGQQSWANQRKRDIYASGNFSTTAAQSTYGVNRVVDDLFVSETAEWPKKATQIIRAAGLTEAEAPTLPPFETSPVILVDDADPGFATSDQTWSNDRRMMEAADAFFGSGYRHTGLGSAESPKWAEWTVTIPESGTYNLYIRYPTVPGGAEYSPIEIRYGDGSRIDRRFTYDQRNPAISNKWIFLGRFPFEAGSKGSIRLKAAGAGIAVADAVKFVKTFEPIKPLDISAQMQVVPRHAILEDEDFFIWGASAVRGPEGRYHLFYSRWPKETGFQSWVTHSEIAHAVADDPLGPYLPVDTALPPREGNFWDADVTHNPTVHYFDGKYYLYYMGNRGDGRLAQEMNDLNWEHRNNQRIGVAVADHPSGPWRRMDAPLMGEGGTGTGPDFLCVSNPTVTKRPDGSFLMIYKAVKEDRPLPFGGPVVHRVALADHPTGPFRTVGDPVFSVEDHDFPAEDPYVWFDQRRDLYFSIVKDQAGHFTQAGRSLALFQSTDGISWMPAESPLVTENFINWENGRQAIYRLERPQLLLIDGIPTVLFLSALVEDNTFGRTFNVHVPLGFQRQN